MPLHDEDEDAQPTAEKPESIKVLVRVRPLNPNEEVSEASAVRITSSTTLSVETSDGKRSFQCSYDAVLGPSSQQTDVYSTVRECTGSVLQGFNSTIFAYGQVMQELV